jgi:RNA polymerase sigma factor (sigma-70 family)
MVMTASPPRDRRAAFLADPALASALARFVRTRVPEAEIDDIVQSTLADALASGSAPEDSAELKPWVFGIARNKVADFFRRTRREVARDPSVTEEVAAAESAPQSAKDLLRWAERELPDGEGADRTLEWMLREGAGEKLETIAEEANVPAPRVRQRVARLRKHFRARWAAQLAAVAALVAIAIAIWTMWRRRPNDIAVPEPPQAPSSSNAPLPPPAPPEATPEERAAALRHDAFDACDAKDWRRCLDGFDAAKQIDAAGDADERVQRARKAATDALAPPLPPQTKDSEPKKAPPPQSTVTTPAAPAPTDAPITPPGAKPVPKPPSPKAGPGTGAGSDSMGDFKDGSKK